MLRPLLLLLLVCLSASNALETQCGKSPVVIDLESHCALTYNFKLCLFCPGFCGCGLVCTLIHNHSLLAFITSTEAIKITESRVCTKTCQVKAHCGCDHDNVACLYENPHFGAAAHGNNDSMVILDNIFMTARSHFVEQNNLGRGHCVHTCRTKLNSPDYKNPDCGGNSSKADLICIRHLSLLGPGEHYFDPHDPHDSPASEEPHATSYDDHDDYGDYYYDYYDDYYYPLLDDVELKDHQQQTNYYPPPKAKKTQPPAVKKTVRYDGVCIPRVYPEPATLPA